jgi:hypothetical protein
MFGWPMYVMGKPRVRKDVELEKKLAVRNWKTFYVHGTPIEITIRKTREKER